jgi:hypothetical protein
MKSAFLFSTAILFIGLMGLSACTSGGEGGGGSGSSGTGGETCVTPPSPAVFEAGTGEACFERLGQGQTVKVLQGPQGGYHIWLAIGCADCGAKTTVEYGVKNPATMTWYEGPQQASVRLAGSAWPQEAGFTALLPGRVWDDTTLRLPKGTHVLLSASILAPDGATLHQAEVEVVLGDIEEYSVPCNPDPITCGLSNAPCCGLDG